MMTTNIMGWVLSAIVLLLLFVAGAILMNPVRLLITGERAMGAVVGLDSTSSNPDIPGADQLFSPIVEFATSTGERIKVQSQTSYPSASLVVDDVVTVAYDPSNPQNAQILTLKEFPLIPAGTILGFAVFFLLIWITVLLISQDPGMDDPLHLLSSLIANFRINPRRFPFFLIMSVVIPACLLSTYLLTKSAVDLRSNGIKVPGIVTGVIHDISRVNQGKEYAEGWFPIIMFKDVSGTEHEIRRSLAKPLSRLKAGDKVEVIYPSRRPDQGVVNTWDEIYFPALVWGFFFLAFSICVLLVLKGMILL